MDRVREFYTGVVLGTILFSGACYIGRNRQETREEPQSEVRRLKRESTVIENDIARKCTVYFIYPEDVSKVYWAGADTLILNCEQ